MNRILAIKKDSCLPETCKKCNKQLKHRLQIINSHLYNPFLCTRCFNKIIYDCYCDECVIFMIT